jgi:hypothetical protein
MFQKQHYDAIASSESELAEPSKVIVVPSSTVWSGPAFAVDKLPSLTGALAVSGLTLLVPVD